MAWVTLNEGLWWPRYDALLSSTALSALLDGTAIRYSTSFRSPYSGLLTGIRFAFGTVTTPQDMTFALEGIAANGIDPDDTESQTATYTPIGGDANTVKAITFGSARAVSIGDVVSVVIRWTSTTGSLNLMAYIAGGGTIVAIGGDVWGRRYAAGAWSAPFPGGGSGTGNLLLFLDWNSGQFSYVPGLANGVSRTSIYASLSLDSASSPDEAGNVIVAPLTGYLKGYWCAHTPGSSTTTTWTDNLYDSQSVSVASRSIDVRQGGNDYKLHLLDKPYLVKRGDVLRVTRLATSATAFALFRTVVDANGRLAALPGGADVNCYRTDRTDLGSWTDTNTERLQAGIVYGAIDDGTGPATASWFPQGTILQEGPPIIIPGQG